MKPKSNILYLLHILNDGFQACILLFLPFIAQDLNISLTKVGVLGSFLRILSIILAIPSGYLAYKFGGYKLLLLSLFIYSLGFLGVAISPFFIFIVIAFLLSGFGFGIFHPVAFAQVAKNSENDKKGKNMGNFTAVGDLGRIGLTSIITFIIVYIGWRNTAFIFSLIGVFIFLILIFFVKKNDNHLSKPEIKKSLRFKEFFKNKKFILSTFTGFLDSFASSSLFVFLPFLLLKRGVDPKILGSFTAAFFIGNFFGKSFLGRLADKLSNVKVLIFSEILMAILIIILSNTPIFFIIIITSVILGFFTKGTVPVIQTMVLDSMSDKGDYENGFGINSFVTSIGSTLAPIILGLVSDKFGIVSAFSVSAVFALFAAIPAYLYSKTQK